MEKHVFNQVRERRQEERQNKEPKFHVFLILPLNVFLVPNSADHMQNEKKSEKNIFFSSKQSNNDDKNYIIRFVSIFSIGQYVFHFDSIEISLRLDRRREQVRPAELKPVLNSAAPCISCS